MQYFISFLEGVVTFISPCLLPMLPIYICYFAGDRGGTRRTLQNALGFVLGFSLVFLAMGALAGAIGSFFIAHQTAVNILCGLVVILFGLHFLGVFQLPMFSGMRGKLAEGELGFFSSFSFGVVFSLGWTPCVGVFLGAALMMASQQGQALTGMLMLLCYSLGLGIPFVCSALLLDKLKGAFDVIKRNYKVINLVSGSLLILVGILMMTGILGRVMTALS